MCSSATGQRPAEEAGKSVSLGRYSDPGLSISNDDDLITRGLIYQCVVLHRRQARCRRVEMRRVPVNEKPLAEIANRLTT